MLQRIFVFFFVFFFFFSRPRCAPRAPEQRRRNFSNSVCIPMQLVEMCLRVEGHHKTRKKTNLLWHFCASGGVRQLATCRSTRGAPNLVCIQMKCIYVGHNASCYRAPALLSAISTCSFGRKKAKKQHFLRQKSPKFKKSSILRQFTCIRDRELKAFKGVDTRRRFQVVKRAARVVNGAHAHVELEVASVSAPGRNCFLVAQQHLYGRAWEHAMTERDGAALLRRE